MRRGAVALGGVALAGALVVLWLATDSCRRAPEPPPPPPPPPVPEAASGPVRLLPGDRLAGADLPLPEIQGRTVTLSQLAGPKGLLVLFTSPACSQDAAWEDRVIALGNEAGQLGVGVVGVVPAGPGASLEDLRARAARKGHGFALAVDEGGALARALGATRTPEAFLFTSDRRLAYHGAIDDNAQDGRQVTASYLREAIAALTSGRDVPIAETLVVGCEIAGR